MGLCICETNDRDLMGAAALGLVRAHEGEAIVFAPTFAQALRAQKALAEKGLALGVEAGTPRSWARDRWDVWGDGRAVVDAAQRTLLMSRVVRDQAAEPGGIAYAAGTVQLLCSLAERALPWVGEASAAARDELTDAEMRALGLVERYGEVLAAQGLVEAASVMERLPQVLAEAGVRVPAVVCAGFDELARAERALLVGLAHTTEVTFVACAGEGPAYDLVRGTMRLLADEARQAGVAVAEREAHAAEKTRLARAAELDALREESAAQNAGPEEMAELDASSGGLAAGKASSSVALELGVRRKELSAEKNGPGRGGALLQVSGGSATGGAGAERAAELEALRAALFSAEAGTLRPTGAVRLLSPSGPLAEAELVAREVMRFAQANEGVPRIAVVVPDVRRAWRELVPKLTARGAQVRLRLSAPVLKTEAGRAFMGYATTVARLMELDALWPAPEPSPDGPLVRLGTMDWWPPQELTDFLLCEVAHVESHKAHALDVMWRSNRLLTPGDVLGQLLSAKLTSEVVERATRELLRGRLGSAASKLLAPYAADATPMTGAAGQEVSATREEAVAALAAVMGVAGTLKELGMTADPTCAGAVALKELVAQAELALRSVSVALPVQVAAQGIAPRAEVEVLSRSQAADAAAGSFDAAILCGLTSQELAIATGDDVLTGLLTTLGTEPEASPLARARAQFMHLCALPTRELMLERALFSADAHETYPAVMLTELLSCYERELPHTTLAEDEARANLSVTGTCPRAEASEVPARDGRLDASLRRLVVVPPEGQAELEGGLPVLSASQLESYLECPLKWFSLRRLRLSDSDAGFSPLEMGTFVHRVLELTYAQLFAEGRACLSSADDLAYAHQVLEDNFALHEAHQHLRAGARPAFQALVAHSALEQGRMDRLRKDLSSTLDYVSSLLTGFEPRAFEWEFGRGSHTAEQAGMAPLAHATYAGVAVTGTVDRIDVNAHGQAVIIDYKHKGPTGFFAEYAALPAKGRTPGEPLVLPRRIQALMYAQVVRRAFPDLAVVGALYLSTRGAHALSGAVDENFADQVYGERLPKRNAERVVVSRADDFGRTDARGFEALLDATEAAVAAKVERLRTGHIEADPCDASACDYCPVSNCERRSS